MTWKPIKEFPGYSINYQGSVRNSRGKILKSYKINGNPKHVIVGIYYNGKRHGRSVNKLLRNAFELTHAEVDHAKLLKPNVTPYDKSTLTIEQVEVIKWQTQKRKPIYGIISKLCYAYGVAPKTVSNIKYNRTWKHIPRPLTQPENHEPWKEPRKSLQHSEETGFFYDYD